MTELDAVLTAYQVSVDCHEIVSDLLTKSRKGSMFHGTVFVGKPLAEAKRFLAEAKEELNDLTIVSQVSVFERIIFTDARSPLCSKPLRKRATGLNDALQHFQKHVESRVYEDTERLCNYRDWVAHGKRWVKPAPADPVSAHQLLEKFISQAGLARK